MASKTIEKTAQIESRWEVEKGTWNGSTFVNRKTTTTTRTLTMQIEVPDYQVLQFIGGPTGYEAYHIEALLKHKKDETGDFCICAGTVNRWPACFVSWPEVLAFISEEKS